ncbi:hypothetical protein FGO68_gene13052 [Halteria grandinella]|uniref:Uncharacterized protein n=1 Tax=Halteria grandinella TaxID=5974 RepID=A0A8J8NKQ4_HALGN|nr:hypothetical protein FGO68_gene13052 [Halteria grandinella]
MVKECDQAKKEIQEVQKYRLGKIKSKYLIIQIMCWSDTLDVCVPILYNSCRLFQRLFNQEGRSFILYGVVWEQSAIPKDGELIKTQRDIRLIRKGLKGKKFKLEKIFDIETDRIHPDAFHEKCAGVSDTLCIMKTWEGGPDGGHYKPDENAFIFSLTKQSLHPIQPGKEEFATYHDRGCFCVFGNTYFTDLFVGGWHKGSCIGTSYTMPEGLEKESDEAKTYLAGQQSFQNTAFQVYKALFI